MNLLILSCNTGEGHNSAARAITQYAVGQGSSCETKNALSYWPAGTDKIICGGMVFLYKKMPGLYGTGYRISATSSVQKGNQNQARIRKGKKPVLGLPLTGLVSCGKLYQDLCNGHYDAVICVHILASLMMTEIRKKHPENCPPFYFVETDYTCHCGINTSDADAIFIPSSRLQDDFASYHVDRKRLVATGIPVAEAFYEHTDPIEAKRQLGLPEDRRMVLLMCGSMGCGPMEQIVRTVTKSLAEDTVLVAVCGRNEELLQTLQKDTPANLFPVGFTKQIPLYMDAAEMIITKAGGLSSTEAGTKHLPIVFINAIPGQETKNRDFFAANGCARYCDSAADLSSVVTDLLENPEKLQKMRENLKQRFRHRSAEEIYDYIAQHR